MTDYPPQGQGVNQSNLLKATIDGNIAGIQQLISTGTMTLAGGNNITLSQASNAITISAAAIGAGSFTAGASNLGNLSGITGIISNQLIFAGGDNITLSQSIDVQSATITISGRPHENQTASIVQAVVIGGNTSGTTASASSGTLRLVGGYNITLSQNQNTITISGPEALTAVVSNLGNTAGLTGAPVLMDKLIFVGGNNITLSQTYVGEDVTITIDAQSQSQQTQNIIRDINIVGNTSGTTANITSGTLYLAGGNNITLSQDQNSITISAPEDTISQFSAGISNIGNTSGTSGMATHQIVFAGGNNITLSQSTGIGNDVGHATLTISAANQTVQTQNLLDLTVAGNTSGTLALISSGTLTLAGGNNITLSQDGNAITISSPEDTVTQFSIGLSNVGNTSGNTGTIDNIMVFAGGNNITLSQSRDGQSGTITISAFTQSQQTQNIIRDVNIIGNTSGTTADITSGTINIAGGNNITLSQNANSITISAAAVGAGSFTAGISNLGNTAGTSGAVNNRLIFVGGNNLTISQSVDGQSATMTFNLATVGAGSFTAGISNIGNTSGTSGVVQNQLIFAGGDNVTLSQSVNGQSATLTISAQSQSQQSQNIIRDVNIIGNTSGTTANITSGTLNLAGGNNITLSQNGNAITISAQSQSQQTQNIIRNIDIIGNTSGTTAHISSGTLSIAGGNNITLSQNQNSFTISANDALYAGMSNLGNTSGTTGLVYTQLVFVGGNNITLSQSLDVQSLSATITINAAEDTLTQFSAGMSNLGNTSGTTGTFDNRFILVGGNNVTLSQSIDALNHSGTLTISAQSQSQQTQNIIRDVNIIGNTSGTTANITSGTLNLAGGNNITLSQVANTITISVYNQTVQTQNLIDVSISGNTSGTLALISSGTMTIAGGNNITLNQDGNAITVSGGNSYSAGMSNLGNTSGTTGLVSQRLAFVGSGSITLSQSVNAGSATLTISGSQSQQTQNIIRQINAGGNTSGTVTAITSGTMTLAGGNNITLSQVGNVITISGKADPTLSHWHNGDQVISTIATSNGTFWLVPLTPAEIFPGNMTVSTALLNFSITDAAVDNAHTMTWRLGIYTINGVSLSLLNSASVTWGVNNGQSSLVSGERFATIHSSAWSSQPSFSQTKYYIGLIGHSDTGGDNPNYRLFGYRILESANVRSGTLGIGLTSGNTSMGVVPWIGLSNASRASNAALPTNIQLSQLSKIGNLYGFIPHIQFNNISSNF